MTQNAAPYVDEHVSTQVRFAGRIRMILMVFVTVLTWPPTIAKEAAASEAPRVPYWSQWTGTDGHTTRCFVSDLESQAFASTPQFVRRLPGTVESLLLSELPIGWVGDWHINPKRQWVVVLAGEYYMETSDGVGVTLKSGNVFFGGDQGASAKPGDPKRIGHISRVVGNQPSDAA